MRDITGTDMPAVRGQIDDVIMVGPPGAILRAFEDTLKPGVEALGLEFHANKMHYVAGPGTTEAECQRLEAAGIQRGTITGPDGNEHHGIDVSGIPFGTDEYTQAFLDGRVDEIESTLTKTLSLHPFDAYAAQALFVFTTNRRFSFWLRYCLPSQVQLQIDRLDHVFDAALTKLFDQELDDRTRRWCALPIRNNGMGVPTHGDLARHAFTGAFHDVIPQLFDQRIAGGLKPGFLQSGTVTARFAPNNAYGRDDPVDRNAGMIAGTTIGAEYKSAWVALQAMVGPTQTENVLHPRAEDAGHGLTHAQRHITKAHEEVQASAFEAEMKALPMDDPQANAYFARFGSSTGCAFLHGYPGRTPGSTVSTAVYTVIIQRLFGLPLTAVRAIVGTRIHVGGNVFTVDAYGRSISGVKTAGGGDIRRHNRILLAIHQAFGALKITSRMEPNLLFADLLTPLQQARQDRTAHSYHTGIVPDLLVGLTADRDAMMELKTVGDVTSHSTRPARVPDARQHAVNKRAAKVPREYIIKANKLDREQGHGDPNLSDPTRTPLEWYDESQERWGPIRRRLHELGKPIPVAVGPRGEVNDEAVDLFKTAARTGATRLARQTFASFDRLRQVLLFQLQCRLGVLAQRVHAEHFLERLRPITGGAYTRFSTPGMSRETFGPNGVADAVDAHHNTWYASHADHMSWTGMPGAT